MQYIKIIFGFLVWGILFWFFGHNWLNEKREHACSQEVEKLHPDLALVKRRCVETGDLFVSNHDYGSAAWFYLLGGALETNLNEIESKIDDNFTMNIGHTYVLKGDFKKAEKIYRDYIWYEKEFYLESDSYMQKDYQILARLYVEDKENLEKGLALWNEIYEPIGKIATAYNAYETANNNNNSKDAIKHMEEMLKQAFAFKEKEAVDYWEHVDHLAEMYYYDDQDAKAIEQYKRLEKFYENDENNQDKYQTTLLHIANAHKYLFDYNQALDYYKKELNVQLQKSSISDASVAESYSNIGEMYQNLEAYPLSVKAYEKAITRQHLYVVDVNVYDKAYDLNTLNDYYTKLADCYVLMNDKKNALNIRQKYVAFLEKEYNTDYMILENAHSSLATYSDRNASILLYQKSVKNIQSYIELEYDFYNKVEASEKLFNHLTDVIEWKLEEENSSVVEYMKAFESFQEDEFAYDDRGAVVMAKTYHMMYELYRKQNIAHADKYLEKAISNIKRAIEIERSEESKENYEELLNEYSVLLWEVTYKEGTAQHKNIMSEKLKVLIAEYIAFQIKENNGTQNLAYAYANVGDFYSYKTPASLAIEYYTKALDAGKDSNILLKNNINALFSVYRNSEDINQSQSIHLAKALISWQQENFEEKQGLLASSYMELGSMYNEDNDSKLTYVSYAKAIELLKSQISTSDNVEKDLYLLKEYALHFSKTYVKYHDSKKAVENMQNLVDFIKKEFPEQEVALSEAYTAFATFYTLLKQENKMLKYQEKALLIIEKTLENNNSEEETLLSLLYVYNYDLLSSYKGQNKQDKILKRIALLKEMISEEHSLSHKRLYLKIISQSYLLLEEYDNSMAYLTHLYSLNKKDYLLDCSLLYECYATQGIYLNEKDELSLQKSCNNR